MFYCVFCVIVTTMRSRSRQIYFCLFIDLLTVLGALRLSQIFQRIFSLREDFLSIITSEIRMTFVFIQVEFANFNYMLTLSKCWLVNWLRANQPQKVLTKNNYISNEIGICFSWASFGRFVFNNSRYLLWWLSWAPNFLTWSNKILFCLSQFWRFFYILPEKFFVIFLGYFCFTRNASKQQQSNPRWTELLS